MAGTSYTRQSSLTDGDTITASLFNDEYNQLVNAFAYAAAGTTGHQHDGGAGEGGNIEIIGDQDFKNKIVVDTSNNRWSIFVEVGGTAVEQVRIEDGVVYPVTDSDVDLGTDAARFKAAYIDSITATTSLTLGTSITVSSILDEDDMASNSATALATQQSIKAYVDSQVTAQDLDLTDGTTSISIDLDSEALSVLGGTGIDSTASGNGVTLAIDSTVATLTGTQTLSNKTLATPVISGNLTTDGTIDGRDVAADGTKLDGIEALADVTDTANVTAAGALMDSELTNITAVKALNQGVATTDSPSFVGLTASGEITANGGIALGDNDKATFGDGDDLQIYHDGSHSYIDDVGGTGNLKIRATNLVLQSAIDENYATFVANGAASLFYDNAEKLATTATGIDVTGTATMDGLTVDGAVTLQSNNGAGALNTLQFKDTDTATSTGQDIGRVEFYSADASAAGVQAYIAGQAAGGSGIGKLAFGTGAGGSAVDRLLINNNGDISFYEDTGTTPKFFWDASAESLGIGTSTPSAPLVVNATNASEGIRVQRDGVPSQYLSINEFTGGEHRIYGYGNKPLDIGSTEAVDIRLRTNSDIRMTIDSSGNVGIGASSPSSLLHASGVGATFTLQDTRGTGNTHTLRSSGTNGESLQLDSAQDLYLNADTQIFRSASEVERMRIDSSGNLLVGASSASAKLTVGTFGDTARAAQFHGGSILLDGGAASEIIMGDGNVAYMSIQTTDDATAMKIRNYSGSADLVTIERASGNVGIGTTSAPSRLTVKSPDNTLATNIAQFDSLNGGAGFKFGYQRIEQIGATVPITFETGGSESMRIDSSGNFLVGKTAAGSIATVTGCELLPLGLARMSRNNGPSGQFNLNGDDGNIVIFSKGGTTVGSIGYSVGALTLDGGVSRSGLYFGDGAILPRYNGSLVNGVNADLGATGQQFQDLYLSGTATTGGLVVQQGSGANILLESTTTGATAGDIFGEIEFKTNDSSSAGVKGKIDSYSEGGVGNGALRLFTGDTTGLYERLRISSSGNVGIGTSNPDTSLHVTTPSGTKTELNLAQTAVTNYRLSIPASTDALTFVYGANTERMRIDASGNVGIGTSSPADKLDTPNIAIGGSSISGAYRANALFLDNTSGTTRFFSTGGTTTTQGQFTFSGVSSNGSLNTERMRIDTSGNVILAAGIGTLQTATAGVSNFRAGVNAGNSIIAGGNYNVVVGDEAGTAITTGERNSAFGTFALATNISGTNNVANGFQSLYSNTGNYNTAVGSLSLQANTTASTNTAVGYASLSANTTGVNNVALGANALDANTTANANIAIGKDALGVNTTGASNIGIGHEALGFNVTSSQNTAIGYAALWKNTAANNTAIGFASLQFNTTGTENTATGWQSLKENTTGNYNSAFGLGALQTNTTGSYNTATGQQSLYANTTASNNTASGYRALFANTTGSHQTASGFEALATVATTSFNTAYGSQALKVAVTDSCVAVGAQSLVACTSGAGNTAVGRDSMGATTTGANNVAVGKSALYANTTGADNVAVGINAGNSITTGATNTLIGKDSGRFITTGSNNTVLGPYHGNQGGLDIRTSSNNIVLSDGVGNPRLHINSSGNALIATTNFGGTVNCSRNGNTYNYHAVTDANNTTEGFFRGYSSAAGGNRIIIYSNGNIVNSNNSYGAISDLKLKENITDVTPKLDKLNQVRVVNYNLKGENLKQIGVIAQEIEDVFPSMVTQSPDQDENGIELGTTTKSVKYSVFVPMLIKAIQEQQALIESLTARIETLEG